ncbi:hypothetical protein ACHAQH_004044 [Verticillium albo-atrum]
MKALTFALLSMSGTCLALGRWKTFDCGDDTDVINRAFSDAIIIAETAADVLQNNFNSDPVVKQMVEYILGAGDSVQAKLDRAAVHFNGIKQYDKQASMFLGRPGADNEDVLIHCKSVYQDRTSANGQVRLYHADLNLPQNAEQANIAKECFNPDAEPAQGQNLVMAITLSSDKPDPRKVTEALKAWQDAGSPLPPGPDFSNAMVLRPEYPNAIDLCSWYLKFVRDGGRGFARFMKEGDGGATVISKEVVDRIRDPNFDLGTTGNTKMINVLTESLAGTLLHELSHTNLGGKTLDMPPGNCYGWDCVKEQKDPDNADSMNHLGVAMYLWKNGYRVTEDGKVETL